MCRNCAVSKEDKAANRVLQGLFDDSYIYDETFRRVKADPELKARLDEYNAACGLVDDGQIRDDQVATFNDLENAYYEEVFGPVSQAVAKEVLDRAAELAQYEPYGPKEKDDVSVQ